MSNNVTAISKFISCKNNGNGFSACVAPHNTAMVVAKFFVLVIAGYRFFLDEFFAGKESPLSFAASR